MGPVILVHFGSLFQPRALANKSVAVLLRQDQRFTLNSSCRSTNRHVAILLHQDQRFTLSSCCPRAKCARDNHCPSRSTLHVCPTCPRSPELGIIALRQGQHFTSLLAARVHLSRDNCFSSRTTSVSYTHLTLPTMYCV